MTAPDEDEKITTYQIIYPPNVKFFMPGGHGALYHVLDHPGQVVKVPIHHPDYEERHRIERQIYERLGNNHPNIVKILRTDEYGFYMDLAVPGSVRLLIKQGIYNSTVTLEEKVSWCEDVARATQYLHDKDVRLPTIRNEIHCLGSTIYELVMGQKPHYPLEDWEIEELLKQGKYPDVSETMFGDIISRCWKGEFSSAGEVADEIARAAPRYLGMRDERGDLSK